VGVLPEPTIAIVQVAVTAALPRNAADPQEPSGCCADSSQSSPRAIEASILASVAVATPASMSQILHAIVNKKQLHSGNRCIEGLRMAKTEAKGSAEARRALGTFDLLGIEAP
jgi:hypothetical protein